MINLKPKKQIDKKTRSQKQKEMIYFCNFVLKAVQEKRTFTKRFFGIFRLRLEKQTFAKRLGKQTFAKRLILRSIQFSFLFFLSRYLCIKL